MILDPAYALVGGFQLTKVVKGLRIGAYNGSHHCTGINHLLRHNGAHPAGGTTVNVRVANLYRSGAYADQRGVAATAVHSGALSQTQLFGSLGSDFTHFIGALFDLRQVLHIHAYHIANGLAPALVALAGVIQQGAECRILGHHEFTGQAADEILFHIQPLIDFLKVFRLVLPHPAVLPNRVLNRGGYGTGIAQVLEQLGHFRTGDLYAVGNALLQLIAGSLVHIGHGAANAIARFVYQDQTLHGRAEADALYLVFGHAYALIEHIAGGAAHGAPPFIGVLLGAALYAGLIIHIQTVACGVRGQNAHGVADLNQTGLDPGGAHIVGDYIFAHKISSHGVVRGKYRHFFSNVNALSTNFSS